MHADGIGGEFLLALIHGITVNAYQLPYSMQGREPAVLRLHLHNMNLVWLCPRRLPASSAHGAIHGTLHFVIIASETASC